jgi:hypothetical protein
LANIATATATTTAAAPLQPEYYYWKFLTAITEKLAYVLIVTLASTELAIYLCVAVMATMLVLSHKLGPFANDTEDQLDTTTRAANLGNAVIALCIRSGVLGEQGSKLVANLLLFGINLSTAFYIVRALNPMDLWRALKDTLAKVKAQRELEEQKRGVQRAKTASRVYQVRGPPDSLPPNTYTHAPERSRHTRTHGSISINMQESADRGARFAKAAKAGNTSEVEALLLVDVDLDWQMDQAALRAAYGARPTLAQKAELGWTVAHLCASLGGQAHTRILALLCQRCCSLALRDSRERGTALHIAWACGSAGAVRILLDAGADAELTDSLGRRPAECWPRPLPIGQWQGSGPEHGIVHAGLLDCGPRRGAPGIGLTDCDSTRWADAEEDALLYDSSDDVSVLACDSRTPSHHHHRRRRRPPPPPAARHHPLTTCPLTGGCRSRRRRSR